MLTNETLQLSPSEILPNRPFTHPNHTQADLIALEQTRTQLRENLQLAADSSFTINGERHRFIVLNRQALLTAQPITVVGFCGTQRLPLGGALLEEMSVVDGDLVRELAQHPDMLTYSSIQIEDGNWRNLVLLRSNEGIEHWRESQRHVYATNLLSPRYYTHVRLHNGVLSHGLASSHIHITSTKYYDFESEPTWRAMRIYS
jgi:hypothetical protein